MHGRCLCIMYIHTSKNGRHSLPASVFRLERRVSPAGLGKQPTNTPRPPLLSAALAAVHSRHAHTGHFASPPPSACRAPRLPLHHKPHSIIMHALAAACAPPAAHARGACACMFLASTLCSRAYTRPPLTRYALRSSKGHTPRCASRSSAARRPRAGAQRSSTARLVRGRGAERAASCRRGSGCAAGCCGSERSARSGRGAGAGRLVRALLRAVVRLRVAHRCGARAALCQRSRSAAQGADATPPGPRQRCCAPAT
jgi:hypothetical protein